MEKCKSVEQVDIPDGNYQGVWGGYEVEVLLTDGTKSHSIKVTQGIRCMACPCTVDIIDRWAYISDKPKNRVRVAEKTTDTYVLFWDSVFSNWYPLSFEY